MTQSTLYITLRPAPAALERLLRLVRHRGFELTQVQWQPEGVRLSVTHEHPLSHLTRQLEKLADVVSLSEEAV
ncbi:ACT domain-containing protein [Gallaecimonas pentaromativorans]|uniref:Acetolactate synthase small subunit n=1 Tax=Gallaecimonas pentaromativorans TaxID=584787 RepID=A0A3N1PKK7_9GAMM|nr:acetolactate synthase 2 small subunit [Gallaecimonas pentaromativorans]MED5523804.1 acetolactate synthase 2 small subunit [Pseudomonadota bacterium]ROQ27711.1 acetolactate synthase small subunit [Gallaecimonas pentaromativorans]